MGGAGVRALPQGVGVMLTTVCVVITLIRSSSAYLLVRHCQGQQDCFNGEFCKNQQECHCLKDFVREPGGACLAVRRAGEPCELDEQCSGVDAHLVCYNGRCQCPHGIKMADGTCLPSPPPPTPAPASVASVGESSSDEPRKIRSAERDETLSPALVILLIFLSLVILLLTSIYRVRVRRRTGMIAAGAARGLRDEEFQVNGPRRVSLTTIIDDPPSYSSLPPPTYEQATQQAALMVQSTEKPLLTRRSESCGEEPLAGSSSSSIPVLASQFSSGFTSLTDLMPPAEANGVSSNRERY